jgi:spermidine/putrescine transport system substrate-binding protein
LKKLILSALTAVLVIAMFAGCSPNNGDSGTESGDTPENKGSVNVYNWGEYIDESLLDDFTEQTGIKVNYSTFESNESMYTILRGGGADYDVIIPSDYMISRLIQEDMLEKLDYANIPNIELIDETYRSKEYDPTNEYSVPYMWGTVGIIYDPSRVDTPVTSWGVLFDSAYAGDILMFDNPRDAMGIALKYLGYSLNTTNIDELEEAKALLTEQKPILQAYVMDQIFEKLEGGEAGIGPYYAGDYLVMLENNPDLEFVLPEEGSNIFIDAMCIPKGAKNKTNAEIFINFMCSTDAALRNAETIGYGTPSWEAYEQLDDEIKNDPVSYPPQEVLDRCETFVNLPDDILEWYSNMWSELKS